MLSKCCCWSAAGMLSLTLVIGDFLKEKLTVLGLGVSLRVWSLVLFLASYSITFVRWKYHWGWVSQIVGFIIAYRYGTSHDALVPYLWSCSVSCFWLRATEAVTSTTQRLQTWEGLKHFLSVTYSTPVWCALCLLQHAGFMYIHRTAYIFMRL